MPFKSSLLHHSDRYPFSRTHDHLAEIGKDLVAMVCQGGDVDEEAGERLGCLEKDGVV
jgi:hypothetical protein